MATPLFFTDTLRNTSAPGLVSDLSGWWDVSAGDTVTITNGRVSRIRDLSGLGRDLIEVGTDGPTYEAAGLNGRQSMLFNGTDEYLIADAVAADFSGDDKPLTIIMAMQWTASAVGDRLFGFGNSASGNPFWELYGTAAEEYRTYKQDDAAVSATNLDDSVNMSGAVLTYQHAGTTESIFLNGAATTVSGSASDVGTTTLNRFTLGAGRRNGAAGNFANARAGEICIFKRSLSDTEREPIEDYLLKKWITGGWQYTRTAANNYLSGWRAFDLAKEKALATNWPFSGTAAGAGSRDSIGFERSLSLWFLGGDNGAGNPTAHTSWDGQTWTSRVVPASDGLDPVPAAAASGAGVLLIGGTPGIASASKIRRSTDGTTWVAQNMSDATAAGVSRIIWEPVNGLFVATLDTGGKLETSATGLTGSWTSCTMPAVCGTYTWADLAADDQGKVIVVSNTAASSYFAVSSDCQTWTAKAVTAGQYRGIVHSPGHKRWFAFTNNTIISSSNGNRWSSAGVTTPTDMDAFYAVACTGNVLILSCKRGADDLVFYSDDGAATWTSAGKFTSAPASGLHFAAGATGGGQLGLVNGSTGTKHSMKIAI